MDKRFDKTEETNKNKIIQIWTKSGKNRVTLPTKSKYALYTFVLYFSLAGSFQKAQFCDGGTVSGGTISGGTVSGGTVSGGTST